MRKLKVASFTPHPDDMEILYGGTLLKYVEQGHDVYVVVGTDGRRGRGTLEDSVTWEEIVEIRKKEATEACAILGVTPIFLEIEDHRVIDSKEDYETVITIMEEINPDVIFTCSPNDYHSDHRALSRLVLNSAWAPVLYAETAGAVDFIPDYYVDITDQIDKKVEMARKHKSQFAHDPEESIRVVNRFRAMQCRNPKTKYAECFKAHKRVGWTNAHQLLPEENVEIKETIVPTTERN